MITIPVWGFIVALVLILAIIAGVWASDMASRLNRLHIRTDSARVSLEGALHSRSSVISALQPELGQDVAKVNRVALRATDMGARSGAENELLSELNPEVWSNSSFLEASAKVDLAARFYNDAVSDTLGVRSRPLVRALRLAGRAPLPEYYEALLASPAPTQKPAANGSSSEG
ncbi:hypothetical protein ACKFRT_02720 [Corynebacterium sp. YSMAA1_1_F7]|uniref:hypothetical protein n=1 Tax=Corynebacterium sp. YSMAA1_1_F7 TaxID=3383590 RepID=UPI0038D220D0